MRTRKSYLMVAVAILTAGVIAVAGCRPPAPAPPAAKPTERPSSIGDQLKAWPQPERLPLAAVKDGVIELKDIISTAKWMLTHWEDVLQEKTLAYIRNIAKWVGLLGPVVTIILFLLCLKLWGWKWAKLAASILSAISALAWVAWLALGYIWIAMAGVILIFAAGILITVFKKWGEVRKVKDDALKVRDALILGVREFVTKHPDANDELKDDVFDKASEAGVVGPLDARVQVIDPPETKPKEAGNG